MIEFTIADMTCSHCEAAITGAVKKLAPTAQIDIDLAAHRVCIEGTDDAEAIAAAIIQAGYTPVPA